VQLPAIAFTATNRTIHDILSFERMNPHKSKMPISSRSAAALAAHSAERVRLNYREVLGQAGV
jgi:hypothetical protein